MLLPGEILPNKFRGEYKNATGCEYPDADRSTFFCNNF